jgi:hypothetical protein
VVKKDDKAQAADQRKEKRQQKLRLRKMPGGHQVDIHKVVTAIVIAKHGSG